jgi:hexosaminidase
VSHVAPDEDRPSPAVSALKTAIVPRPLHLREVGPGFLLNADTRLCHAGPIEGIARLLRDRLSPATGFPFPAGDETDGTGNAIVLELDDRAGASAYELLVNGDGIRIRGGDEAGLFHGTQTLTQLLPPQIFRRTLVPGAGWQLPGVEISDRPRFAWRGMMLDVSRHFFGVEAVLKLIDILALQRMNVLHLHLTDDQGWRMEIKRYPLLTEIGAWRTSSMIGRNDEPRDEVTRYDMAPHDGFFTQEDLREIVAYAASRYITVVPEIDLPGHSQAAMAAYPWLGNTGEPLQVWTDWGINSHVLNVGDETISFYKGVFEEVMDVFPGKFVHVGGDECPKDEWRASPAAQARMRELGLADEDQLQSWVIRQMDEFLTARGRRLVGWDEILEGGLAPGATVMSWRGEDGGIAAARAGHDVVMAPDESTYLYHHQSDDPTTEPPGVPPKVDLRTVYTYDPVPAELTAAEARHVLGAQCQMWTEFVVSERQMQQMVFPRLCAFSEVVWADHQGSFEEFESRLRVHVERLRVLDVAVFSEPKAHAG